MDAVKEALAKLGSTWDMQVPATLMKLFEPLQAEQNAHYVDEIKADKALKYGSDPKNRIDVYTPVEAGPSSGSGRPVVVYFHGGGYVTGDNDSTPNIYSNVGNYFTKNGCITCLATYRLAFQGGHFPDGPEDVAAALKWVQANISAYGGNPAKVIAVGQSAGGAHLSSAMFLGMLDPASSSAPLLRGAITLSAAFTSSTEDASHQEALKDWFQTEDVFELNGRWSPAAIFRQQFFGTTSVPPRKSLPCEYIMMVSEYEATEILDGTWEFVNEYRKRFGRLPVLEVMKGHNHVSYCFGLGLADANYEKVGTRILDFVKDCTS